MASVWLATMTQPIYLSLKQLMRGLGLEYNTITKHDAIRNASLELGQYQKGKGTAKLYELNYIAKAYNVDPEELLAKCNAAASNKQVVSTQDAIQEIIKTQAETIKILKEQLDHANNLAREQQTTIQTQASDLQTKGQQIASLVGEIQRINFLEFQGSQKKSSSENEIEASFTNKTANESTEEVKPVNEAKNDKNHRKGWFKWFG